MKPMNTFAPPGITGLITGTALWVGLCATPLLADIGTADTLKERARMILQGQAEFECYDALHGGDFFEPCGTDRRIPRKEVVEVSREVTIDRPGRVWLEGEAWCDWCHEVASRWQLQLQRETGPDAWEEVFTGGGWGWERCIGDHCLQNRISPNRLPRIEPGTYRLFMHQATATPDNMWMTYNKSRYDIQAWFLPDEPYVDPGELDRLRDELREAEADATRCRDALEGGRRVVARLERNLRKLEDGLLAGQSSMGSGNILADQALQQQLHRVGANHRYVLDALDPQRPVDRLKQRIADERTRLEEQAARCRALDRRVAEIRQKIDAIVNSAGAPGGMRERRSVQ